VIGRIAAAAAIVALSVAAPAGATTRYAGQRTTLRFALARRAEAAQDRAQAPLADPDTAVSRLVA
jgi:hypothetical protein